MAGPSAFLVCRSVVFLRRESHETGTSPDFKGTRVWMAIRREICSLHAQFSELGRRTVKQQPADNYAIKLRPTPLLGVSYTVKDHNNAFLSQQNSQKPLFIGKIVIGVICELIAI